MTTFNMNFRKIRGFLSLAISGLVVALSLTFLIYPAVIICAVMIDPHLKHSGESRWVPLWFESAAHRYVSWSDAYLNSKYAESLQHYDVAATEWPMFGSAFFLVAAEDLHSQGKIDATQGVVRQAVDNAAAKLDQTNHNELAESLMSVLEGPLQTPEKLPAFTVNSVSGTIIQDARGCGNSGILMLAAELDAEAAARWYSAYEEKFWKKTWWAVGFTELPRGSNLILSDVDSGPVVSEFGSVASAFGIGAAKTVGRFDHAAPLTQEAVALSWPTPFGPLLPGIMGSAAADSWCLGEVALLFSMTRPAQTADTTPFTDMPPLLVWMALLFFAGTGTFFIWFEIRSWRQLNRKRKS